LRKERILAVIPARGGSKRLPRKNIRPLAGLPLIAWTIRTAIAARIFDEVLVSTDDTEIADIAIRFGASVPGLRPRELSTDTATSVDVVLHALSKYEAEHVTFKSVMLLQPTSPFRSVETIRRAVRLHEHAGNPPVVSLCPAKAHPAWCFLVDSEGCMSGYAGDGTRLGRAQDLPPVYQLNGSVYLATVDDLRNERSFIGSRTQALLVTKPEESIDIDDAWDWQLAECIAAGLGLNKGAAWHRE
jgi:N-acylneuraminate cytidylyltransferase/CMP-N,N'-diacetyllegionaminic acid synthase